MMKKAVLSAITIAALLAVGISSAFSQTAGSDCMINQSAEAAMQRQIALLDAAKVNPQEFFKGQNSCISPDLLSTIDLSSLIPSSVNLVQGNVQSQIQQLIGNAQNQVCEVLNSQLQNTVGNINGQLGNFQSQLGGDLAGILGNGGSFTPVSLPSIPGIGEFKF